MVVSHGKDINMNTDIISKAVMLRHELHEHPELSYNEVWTKSKLMEFIRENSDLEVVDCGKYFYAIYRAEKTDANKGAIAFRADFDALPMEDRIDTPYKSAIPGIAHKCGHDGHAATLCGFAMTLQEIKPNRDIYLIFQHAEETGQGAIEAKQVLLDNPDITEIFAYHNEPCVEENLIRVADGSSNCASVGMSIFLTGSPTHASIPEKGVNPVFSFARIVNELPNLTNPENHKGLILATVVQLDLGECAFGMAASSGVIRMTIRAEYEEELNTLQKSLEIIALEEAEKYGMECRFEFSDVFPETRNHGESVRKVYAAAKKCGYTCETLPLVRGSEDFGWFTKEVPGAIFNIGAGEDWPSVHTFEFDFNDHLIKSGIEMFKALTELA